MKRVFLLSALLALGAAISASTRFHSPDQQLLRQRCERLMGIIQGIAQRIQANTLATSSKRNYHLWLTNLAQLTHHLQKSSTKELSPEQYRDLFIQHAILIQQIIHAIRTNFAESPSIITTSQLLQQANEQYALAQKDVALSPDTIRDTDGELLYDLENLIPVMGLSKLNIAYRTAYTTLANHATAVKIGTSIAIGAALLAGVYGLHHILKKPKERNRVEMALTMAGQAFSPLGLFSALGTLCNNTRLEPAVQTVLLSGALVQATKNMYAHVEGTSIPDRMQELWATLNKRLWGNEHVIPVQEKEEFLTLDDPKFILQPQTQQLKDIARSLTNAEEWLTSGIHRPTSYLLAGPAGCGKSLSLVALQGTIRKMNEKGIPIRFITLSITDFYAPNLKFVRALIEANAPCILVIDEFHLFGSGNDNKPLIRDFLLLIDEIHQNKNPRKQAVIIGVTNRKDLLDEALFRSGRFSVIEYQKPHFAQRAYILANACKQAAITIDKALIEHIAYATHGCVHSDLDKLFEEAVFQAKEHKESIERHLYAALNTVIRKLTPITHLSQEEITNIATYQAGKALTHIILQPTTILESVTTLGHPRESAAATSRIRNTAQQYGVEYGAMFSYATQESVSSPDSKELSKQCKILIAGSMAQKILLKNARYKNNQDYAKAYTCILEKLANGIALDALPLDEQQKIKNAALKKLKKYEQKIEILLKTHKRQLTTLIEALRKKQFLTRLEVDAIIAEKTA